MFLTRLVAAIALIAAAPLSSAFAQAPRPAAASPRSTATAEPYADYKIGADDTIEVDLLGQADFKTRARVKSDGTISLPYLGVQNVVGQTPQALAKTLQSKLVAGGFYSKPVINVEVVSFASRYVVVLGDVGTPGLQPVDRAYRVSEIIARSGGLRETGADYVVVSHADGGEERLPFDRLARGGGSDDPYVQPGDKVFVPAADQFYIYGQIAAPGVYPIKNEMTLRKAIARAGGIGANGSEKKVKLFRDGKTTKLKMDDPIQKGDVITVGERLF